MWFSSENPCDGNLSKVFRSLGIFLYIVCRVNIASLSCSYPPRIAFFKFFYFHIQFNDTSLHSLVNSMSSSSPRISARRKYTWGFILLVGGSGLSFAMGLQAVPSTIAALL